MMKLGWGIMTNRDALWVQVLRFKCNCGNLPIPVMRCASHTWRGIVQCWPIVEQGFSWLINNGQSVRFWRDP